MSKVTKAPETLADLIDRIPSGAKSKDIVVLKLMNASNGFAATVLRHGEPDVKAKIAKEASTALRGALLDFFARPAYKAPPEKPAAKVARLEAGTLKSGAKVWVEIGGNIELATVKRFLQPIREPSGKEIDEAYDIVTDFDKKKHTMALSHLLDPDTEYADLPEGTEVMATFVDGTTHKATLIEVDPAGYFIEWHDGGQEIVRLIKPIARRKAAREPDAPKTRKMIEPKAVKRSAKARVVEDLPEEEDDGALDDSDLLEMLEEPEPAPKAVAKAAPVKKARRAA